MHRQDSIYRAILTYRFVNYNNLDQTHLSHLLSTSNNYPMEKLQSRCAAWGRDEALKEGEGIGACPFCATCFPTLRAGALPSAPARKLCVIDWGRIVW